MTPAPAEKVPESPLDPAAGRGTGDGEGDGLLRMPRAGTTPVAEGQADRSDADGAKAVKDGNGASVGGMDDAERDPTRIIAAQIDATQAEADEQLEALRLRTCPLTDAGNAERFAARYGGQVRYVHGWKRWLIWDGTRWAPDDRGEVRSLIVETVRATGAEADPGSDLGKHAKRSERLDRIKAALDLASSLSPIAIVPGDLDRNPNLLNVANGVIHLPSGKRWPHNPGDLCTKIVPVAYDPTAEAPAWRRFLDRVQPDPEIRSYLQRAVGYSATGHVSEHVLFFHHGGGANGKSTMIETLRDVLGEGEYAKAAQPDLLLANSHYRHPVEVADIQGVRLVSTVEAGQARDWDESRVKWLTGGDTVRARHMYGSPFSFAPTHKFWVAANHWPGVKGSDLGFWRRIHLIPWTVTISEGERDRELRGRLRAELPGILRWAVEGAVEWHRSGLRPPAASSQRRRSTGPGRTSSARSWTSAASGTRAAGWSPPGSIGRSRIGPRTPGSNPCPPARSARHSRSAGSTGPSRMGATGLRGFLFVNAAPMRTEGRK